MSNFSYGILASGQLGLICIESFFKKHEIKFVLTDKRSLEIVSFCANNAIPVLAGNPRNVEIKNFLTDFNIDILFSINYLFIIDKDLISFPKKYAINFHGSLLPKYRGRSPHVWAIINNEKETGITAHLISEGCDEGDIVYQEKITITDTITGGEILQQYNNRFPSVISRVIEMLESGELTIKKQDHSKATYFSKRIPEDGWINWDWQKERIYNWVRAQAKPYPGAYTYYNDQKVIIHAIEVIDYGFKDSDQNGLVLKGGKTPIVKTPNGAIKLIEIETDKVLDIKSGEILYAKH